VIGFSLADNRSRRVLGRDGSLWNFGISGDGQAHWVQVTGEDPAVPPVPLDNILFWIHNFVITKDGHGWAKGAAGWRDAGILPVTPASSNARSWSSVKNQFHK